MGEDEFDVNINAAPARPYDLLLDAAADQMCAIPPQPDLARIAAQVGVPVETARQMFPDDDALGAAVVKQQMIRLTDYIGRQTASAAPNDAVAQLRALAHGYVDWCFANPVGNRLLSSANVMTLSCQNEVERFSTAIHDLARSMLERAQAEGRFPPCADVAGILLTLRALTLGAGTLESLDHSRHWTGGRIPHAALRKTVDDYFDLIRRPPG